MTLRAHPVPGLTLLQGLLQLLAVHGIVFHAGDRPGHSPLSNSLVLAPCGSTLTVREGVTYVFTTPGFPVPYSPYTYCRWTLLGGRSSSRFLTCHNFDLEASLQCATGAFLAVEEPGRGLQWFCGSVGPRNIASTTSSLTLHFWSSWHNNNNNKGFYCTMTSRPSTPPLPSSCRCGRIKTAIRIVGGTNANAHEFPWQALIRISENGFCGGALINERFILTAAHCIDSTVLLNGALPEVVLGVHDRTRLDETQTVVVSRVIPHESYRLEPNPRDNDIGLIELATAVNLEATPNVVPACPPTRGVQYDNLPVTAIGWGFTSFPGKRADVLQKVELMTVPRAECASQYAAGVITDNMICAAAPGKDACFDDSGGPLMSRVGQHWQVIGIVSFGPSSCADPNVSGVYTKVANYIPWILSKIGTAKTCPPAS